MRQLFPPPPAPPAPRPVGVTIVGDFWYERGEGQAPIPIEKNCVVPWYPGLRLGEVFANHGVRPALPLNVPCKITHKHFGEALKIRYPFENGAPRRRLDAGDLISFSSGVRFQGEFVYDRGPAEEPVFIGHDCIVLWYAGLTVRQAFLNSGIKPRPSAHPRKVFVRTGQTGFPLEFPLAPGDPAVERILEPSAEISAFQILE